jgi:hypothetical protein
MTARATARRLLQRTGLLAPARAVLRQVYPARRAHAQAEWRCVADIRAQIGLRYAAQVAAWPKSEPTLFFGTDSVGATLAHLPLLAGFMRAGFRPVVLLLSRSASIEATYRAMGVERFAVLEDCAEPDPSFAPVREGATIEDVTRITHGAIRVGKHATSTFMRWSRQGGFDSSNPALRAALNARLAESRSVARAVERILADTGARAAVLNDRDYTPYGEVFDALIGSGGTCYTWNAAHRNGFLMLKRYDAANHEEHPYGLSEPSWDAVRRMAWTPAYWDRLRSEISDCYRRGEWYGVMGTQVDKSFLGRQQLIEMLGLDPAKKTAVIFPPMFWDAPFTWGRNLYTTYADWFAAVLRVAAANRALNWVVKVHPGNIVKERRDGVSGEHLEVAAMRQIGGADATHIRVIPADSPISTYSLFELMDYCLTVRGTVGMEAAAFGVVVVTAGTGRYDRHGFTIDPDDPAEFESTLLGLHDVPSPSEAVTELARRYAYGVLLLRPMPLTSVRFGYRKDAKASLEVELAITGEEDLSHAADISEIAAWLRSGRSEPLRAAGA